MMFRAAGGMVRPSESARQSLWCQRVYSLECKQAHQGGKSGLHRAERQVTPGGREPTESAAESEPPTLFSRIAGKGEKVR